MFGNKKKEEGAEQQVQPTCSGGAKVETVIGSGTLINGLLEVEGTLRVDGSIEGEIRCSGNVIVGETGRVKADISASNVTVAGLVQGNIEARERLSVNQTGKVIGDVKVGTLSISDGAAFQGKCEMLGAQSAEVEDIH